MPLLLLIQVGCAQYGVELDEVQEVADAPTLYAVPSSHGPLLGAINAHGRVLAVIDLPRLLGVAAAPLDHRLVVLDAARHELALAVSAVGRIVPFTSDSLLPSPEHDATAAVAGVVEIEELSVNLLDVDAVIERLEAIYAV
jgi:chemotaxis signal transduction protein